MKNIIGVRFRRLGKIYFFDPKYLILRKGDYVIVDTADGEDIAEVMIPNRKIDDEKIVSPLKKVIRIANPRDMKHYEECKKREKQAFEFCNKKIKQLNLKMKLTDVEYKFNNTKIIFFFTADGRIDFRDLVKELAANYKTRIELRQIGVRDEVKRIGGCGVCGKELCCCTHLSNFETVSIKMAKEQNLSLNISKLSGNCGRLMCCLKYEDNVYEEKLSRLPHVGAIIKTEDGTGIIDSVETLAERVRVKIEDGDNITYKKYNVKDITVIKDSLATKEDEVDSEELKELERLEELDKQDLKEGGEEDGI